MIILGPADAELLTPAEVRRALRVSPDTIRRWARNGKLPCVRIGPGGHRRYRRSAVEALLRERAA